MAKIFLKGGTEATLINGVREWFNYPFVAPNWTDLRIGFFLSLTQALADDTITGLTETISTPVMADYYMIGVKSQQTQEFVGFSNWLGALYGQFSQLLNSDIGLGTSNAFFWRATSAFFASTGGIYTATDQKIRLTDASTPHFPQDTTGAGGYATLLVMRLTRPSPASNSITFSTKKNTHSGDVLFSNAPTADLVDNNLESFPGTVQTIGPYNFAGQLNALYFYWPFRQSRLRIHALSILQVA